MLPLLILQHYKFELMLLHRVQQFIVYLNDSMIFLSYLWLPS